MHLNAPAPKQFPEIAAMQSYTLKSEGYLNLLNDPDAVIQRIKTLFEKCGLINFFERSSGKRINIVSLGAGKSPELSLIEFYTQQFGFTYRYFGLDVDPEVFSHLRQGNPNSSATFHLVDSSDITCIQEEIPVLANGTVDVVLVLQPDIEDEPFPFWKIFLDVIPRLSKPDGFIVCSFLQHSEVVKFAEFTKAETIGSIFESVICQQTVSIEKYIFASQHQWYATLTLKHEVGSYVSEHFPEKTSPLQQLFSRIVGAPRDCYTLKELSDLTEEKVHQAKEEATERCLKLREYVDAERRNWRPPHQTFIYENEPWAKSLFRGK